MNPLSCPRFFVIYKSKRSIVGRPFPYILLWNRNGVEVVNGGLNVLAVDDAH